MVTKFPKLEVLIATAIFFTGIVTHINAAENDGVVLTHADAAVILARYSGLFDRYVAEDANISECVSFLNGIGVYFGLMEVVNGSEFKLNDCARAMGQIELVLNGEAEYIDGKVKLPKNIESWIEFCILSDIRYQEGYQTMRETLRVMVEHAL